MPQYGIVNAPFGSQFATSVVQVNSLGTRMLLEDGRVFRYIENGAVATIRGRVYQSEVQGSNFDELAVAAAVAVGDGTVDITVGPATIAVDDFKEGYLNIEDDAGEGIAYRLTSHPAASPSGTHTGSNNASVLTDSVANFLIEGVAVGDVISNTTDGSIATITAITAKTISGTLAGGSDDDWDTNDAYTIITTLTARLAQDEEIQVALTTSTTVGLTKNPYKAVVIQPLIPTAPTVGVGVSAISANEFGWIQTWGVCSLLINSPVLTPGMAISNGLLPDLGVCVEVATGTEHSLVNLTISS